jgi:hypothetical protein
MMSPGGRDTIRQGLFKDMAGLRLTQPVVTGETLELAGSLFVLQRRRNYRRIAKQILA